MNQIAPNATDAVRDRASTVPSSPFTGPQVWTRDKIGPADWHVPFDEEVRRELSQVIEELRRNPIQTLLLTGHSFAMPASRALMARAKKKLDDDVMFVVLDRLPLDEISADEARQLYWLLCSLMSNPVAQRFDGSMTFDVLDRKVAVVPGSGVRPTVTNADLTFHNDNSYNSPQPDYISLLCLGTPVSGGISKLASVYAVHNALMERNPEVLPRLYRTFHYDRYREHAVGESGIAELPVFSFDGERLVSRIAIPEIVAGYKLAGEEMDDETKGAIDALRAVFADPGMSAELQLERGQIMIANNRSALHSRGEFVDSEDDSNRRHLVRLWLRNEGSRSYTGRGAA